MLRILQQLILTTFFVFLAAQASGMFIQADPMDPTGPGVGTNRYAYSGADPINRMDPSGYAWVDRTFERAFGEGSFDRTFGSGASDRMDRIADSVFGSSNDRAVSQAYNNYSGSMSYSDWRFASGDLTGSYINDAYHSAIPYGSRSPVVKAQFSSALISLSQHEAAGGHTIARHVGLSDAQLRGAVQGNLPLPFGLGIARRTHGTFTSLPSAERLVLSTVYSRPDLVAGVVSGALPDAIINQAFGSPTGREAYRTSRRFNSPVVIRPTYNVRAHILPHSPLPGGFIVNTSFPHNGSLVSR